MKDEIYFQNEPEGLGIKDLFFKYIRFLPLIILSVSIALFGAYLYLRYTLPEFQTIGTILIKNESSGRGDKFEELFMNQSSQNIQNDIEVLKSRQLMERVVRQKNFNVNYFAVGKIKSPNIYTEGPFVLDAFEVYDSSKTFTMNVKLEGNNLYRINDESAQLKFGQIVKNEFGVFRLQKTIFGRTSDEYNVVWQPVRYAASSLVQNISVLPKTIGTGILMLTLKGPHPLQCADVINQLMIEYQRYNVEEKNEKVIQTLNFIDERSVIIGKELDSVQRNLLNYQQANNLINIETQSAEYFSKQSQYDLQINEQQAQVGLIEMLHDYLKDRKNNFTNVPSSLGIGDGTLGALIGAYNNLQIERKTMVDGNIPATNPLVKQKDDQLEKIRENIIESLSNLKKVSNVISADLKNKNTKIISEIKSLPVKTLEFLELKRQVEGKQELYKILLEKREETSISRAATTPNSKIVEKAFPNLNPIKPIPRTIQLYAILLGIALPALLIFLAEISNDKVIDRNDIEKVTDAPILGEVGHSFQDTSLVVTTTSRGMVAEQFRIIRSNLQFVLGKVNNPVIMVTSSFSGEGKSFISMNIGAVLALAGKKTIVLEFDIRKPKILKGLKLPKSAGITNFLLGKEEFENLAIAVPGTENLFVLPCGPVPPNPAELLLDPNVKILFQKLRENYDAIIIDTAPIGMVSDAMTLGEFADNTLFIVRQGYTFKKQVSLVQELYSLKKIPKIAIIINDVISKPGYGYYGYGRYGYGYSSSSNNYYEEETQAKTFLSKFFSAFDLKRWKSKVFKKVKKHNV